MGSIIIGINLLVSFAIVCLIIYMLAYQSSTISPPVPQSVKTPLPVATMPSVAATAPPPVIATLAPTVTVSSLVTPVISSQCKSMINDGNFKKIANKSYLEWTDNDRNTAIIILGNSKFIFANGQSGQAQTNKDLAAGLITCI